jgi:hypothetical protein
MNRDGRRSWRPRDVAIDVAAHVGAEHVDIAGPNGHVQHARKRFGERSRSDGECVHAAWRERLTIAAPPSGSADAGNGYCFWPFPRGARRLMNNTVELSRSVPYGAASPRS